MKKIPLTRGLFAIVDDDRYEALNKYKWCAWPSQTGEYYAMRWNGKGHDYMHHYVAGFPLPGYLTDHINTNGLDEREENLRHIPNYQNCMNRRTVNKSGFPGVYKCRDKWQVKFTHDGITLRFGVYVDKLEAFFTYRNALIAVDKELLPEHEATYQLLKSLNCFKGFQNATT